MIGEHLGDQCCWLSLVEWWYNSTFHSAIQMTLYEALYSQPPPQHLPYMVGSCTVECVDRTDRKLLQFHLKRAQNRMKHFVDCIRSDRTFQVGNLVYLKLQPYRQHSAKVREVFSNTSYLPCVLAQTPCGKATSSINLTPSRL
ncbi:BSD domain-containing protein 1-A-like [Gossypium australe]|uniref:BSD domain-containing protein 1-A-like n=1 Tax=Gossypium australe TaxID=47621 RepID=A0A5B6U5A7_9ROSI|nr:BSD domain-containing protein 1-A-like [Gossypium australe]